MESFWEWLADGFGNELGRASGDDALLGALLDGILGPVAAAASSGALELSVTAGGCDADPSGHALAMLARFAPDSAAVCAIRCAPSCSGGPGAPGGDEPADVVRFPTLHQTDTGPFLVALDRRAGFGVTLASRRLDLPAASWRAASHDVAWSLSPAVAAAAVRHLGGRVLAAGADALPRALAAPEHAQPWAGSRPRVRVRAKPGTSALRAATAPAAAAQDALAAVAGALLAVLQTAAAHECAVAALASGLARGGPLEERLDDVAAVVGRALDASRVAVMLKTAVADDDAPTAQLPGLASLDDVRQGVYTRIDTRRLEPLRLDRGEVAPALARHVTPVSVSGLTVGEIRVTDTRAARSWSPMELALLERMARVLAAGLEGTQERAGGAPDGPRATDRLTGLEERSAFERRMRAALENAGRAGEPVSLVRVRIEGLADVNEAHGYAAGDAVIRRVAALLRERLADDEESALARFGGDGFAVLLPGFTRLAASRVADLLVASIGEAEVEPAGRLRVRAGVATFPECADSAGRLALAARERMLG